MRAVVKWFLMGILVTVDGACTTVLAPERTAAIGPPFNEALKERYLELGSSRWQEGSWAFLHFRDKARSAMLGDLVYPDRVTFVPRGPQDELIEERERLLLFLDAGARELVPEDAAEAQVAFDCWLSDVKASGQLDSGCRETFESALGRTEQAVLAELPQTYVVPFESGSDMLGGDGLNVARAVPLVEPAQIEVVGYADPWGTTSANDELSQRRAENMAAALQRAGVSAQLLNVQSRGATADGRRVEVMFRS
jgi:OmpA-OmpF porin, OOP family